MKSIYWSLGLGLSLLASPLAAFQFGAAMPQPTGPQLGGALSKLFGDHQAYSATMTVEAIPAGSTQPVSLPGALHYLDGQSRFEMDLSKAGGLALPAEVKGQLQKMGLSEMVMISQPKEQVSYFIYPRLKSYVPMPIAKDQQPPEGEVKMESKEEGREKIEGQDTVKHQVTLTDDTGQTFEATVWNAPALKNFPVRIQTTDNGQPVTMSFREVKFEKPASGLFQPPAGYTRYENVMNLMQEAILKQFGGGGGVFPQ